MKKKAPRKAVKHPTVKTSSSAALPRIFVSIASYRDPECQWTVKDLFEKAAHPERVFVGICWQADKALDADCFTVPAPRSKQVRSVHYTPGESKGGCWARAQALALLRDEEYVLQIDAHMRAVARWDEVMLEQLQRCQSKKAVLSTTPPTYAPPNQLQDCSLKRPSTCVTGLGGEDDLQPVHLARFYQPVAEIDKKGISLSAFFVGNFLFAPAAAIKEVPFDPHIYFRGQELTYSARLWTHGWDIYQPDRVVIYHYWEHKNRDTGNDRDYKKNNDTARLARQRVWHLLGIEKSQDSAALAEIEKYGMGNARPLHDFWAFAGVDLRASTVSLHARKGEWTPYQAASHPRIFVQIASYRDPDCQWTVKDLFEKAVYPERISVGICWQTIEAEDAHCFEIPSPYPQQMRIEKVDARESKGVCWARSRTQLLWQGEEFTLQIDSHMRFEPGWDETMLAMWRQCANPGAVLTCYPPGFTPPDQFEREWIFGMAAKEFDADDIFLMQGAPAFPVASLPALPIAGAFASACMLFGPASVIRDVPYDPHLYFFGEEIALAVRLWTHGYDFYHPNQLVIFHNWVRDKRRTHFSDHDWNAQNRRSFARVRHLLGTQISHDAETIAELDRFGLGKARSLAQYQDYSGVNFAAKTISEKAYKGEYTASTNNASARDGLPRIFVNIASYRDPECQWTVKDLFEKATHPERIFVGICWQFDEKEDQHCFQIATRPEQVRVFPVDWREAEGVCWARWMVQQLWEDEEYTLMIDSHMRFVPGWDELMIAELAACPAEKPLLSCSPPPYTPPDNLEKNARTTIRRVKPFMADGSIRCKGEYLDVAPELPLKGAFLVANFIFSRSTIIGEVPYDPYLYFDQEEITYAIRLYTHGWDIFSSRQPLLFHYYNDHPQGSTRPLHWRDLHQEDSRRIAFLRQRGVDRFNHLTGYKISADPEVLRELDSYGFGHVRSLAQFEAYTGVDFKRKIASEKALRGLFIENLHQYRRTPIYVEELDGKHAIAPPQLPVTAQAMTLTIGKIQNETVQPNALRLLDNGDFLPMITMEDTDGRMRAIELYAGRYIMLVYLGAQDIAYAQAFFAALKQAVESGSKPEIWYIFIFDAPVEQVKALRAQLRIGYECWSDPGRKVARAFGLPDAEDKPVQPLGFLLNQNLKIVHRAMKPGARELALNLVEHTRRELEIFRIKNREPRRVEETPPALIVPHALSPELCAKCIQAFKTGYTFEGTVGAEEKQAYLPQSKVRTDYIVGGELLAEIDEKLSASFFPEVKKIFGFEVTHRELYKIGLYIGEKGGFFKQHRDNYEEPLGYRRVAATIHLSDNYEGGGLRFPEYDRNVYRPAVGSAIAFSGSTLHEALPVTQGERYILVAFIHGDEDEAYRRAYLKRKDKPLKIENYELKRTRRNLGVPLERHFYTQWKEQNVRYDNTQVAPATAVITPPVMVNMPGGHQAKKTFSSGQAIIFDDFLPPDVYEKVHHFALTTDYEYINTNGKISRAWHIQDGFPLRSALNLFYHTDEQKKPKDASWVYPTKTPFDLFTEQVLAIQPEVEQLTGKKGVTDAGGWEHFSVTSWIYPHGTGLALHDDGSGVYTGAYVFFLNQTWRAHWGGLLLLADEEGNRMVHEYRNKNDQHDFYKRSWLHANPLDDLLLEHGYATCVMPRKNRMVFIANDAYHMVTRVNEQSGDNVRMSLAGFFNRGK